MNLLLLLFTFYACVAKIHSEPSPETIAIENGPILTIKHPRSYDTYQFINKIWRGPTPFEESAFAQIVSKCYTNDFSCWSHSDGILDRGYEETNTMSNVIFIASETEDKKSFFCATSWSGFNMECMSGQSIGDCARSLPNKMQQAFFCTNMHLDDLLKFRTLYYHSIYIYTTDNHDAEYRVGFGNTDGIKEFSNRTGLYATLTRPVKGAPNYDELKTRLLEDAYQHFAERYGVHMMVRTCTHKSARQVHSIHGIGDPMVFNVERSLHPFLRAFHEGKSCIDNIKLAYSVPLNKEKDAFYVCFGDLPRNLVAFDRGGGLYCWIDKELNMQLRCSTVPDVIFTEDGPAHFELDEIAEWFSDCPPDGPREALVTLVKMKFDNARNGGKKRVVKVMNRVPDEL